MDLQTFIEVLRGIYCPVPHIIESSSAAYQALSKSDPDGLINLLLNAMVSSDDIEVRQVSILLLRRAFIRISDSLWEKIAPNTKIAVKQTLLSGLHHEPSPLMRHKLNDAVADLAAQIAPDGEWPELLDELFNLSNSNESMHRESSLSIFGQLLNAIQALMEPHLETVRNIFIDRMNDAALPVKVSAVVATTGFLKHIRNHEHKMMLSQMIPSMLQVLKAAMETKQTPPLGKKCIEAFLDWAQDPTFFDPYLTDTLELMYMICRESTIQDHQYTTVEFLVSLAVNNPEYMGKVPDYVAHVSDILLTYFQQVDQISIKDWNEMSESDRMEISNSDQIENALDKFCMALGGKLIVPVMLSPLVQLINSQVNWMHRYAGLVAISIFSEGCRKALTADLEDIVALVLPTLNDEHPRVRWAALGALGQFSSDFAPHFQTRFHQDVMPLIVNMYKDENPKVQSYVSSAIISYAERAPPETLIPYLDDILTILYPLMNTPVLYFLTENVSCLGSIASTVKEHFIPYYSHFAPFLKNILLHTRSTDPAIYTLRSRTIETFSMVGKAVGAEAFAADAREFMESMAQTHLGEFGKEESMRTNMLYAAARVCKILGEHFTQYLPMIMPTVLETAAMKEEVYLDVGEDGENEKSGWDYIVVGVERIGFHTDALAEKNAAVSMIFAFLENIPGGMVPYLHQIIDILVPLVNFPYSQAICAAAATTLPLVAQTVKEHSGNHEWFLQLFDTFLSVYLTTLRDMELEATTPIVFDAACELIELIEPDSIADSYVQSILDVVETTITNVMTESRKRDEIMESGHYSREEEHEWAAQDNIDKEICTECGNLFGSTIRTQKNVMVRHFQSKIDFFMSLIQYENKDCVRQIGICIFDDAIEHLKEPTWPLIVHLMPFMIAATNDENPALRQAGSYGLGTVSQNGGAEFSNWVEESLQALVNLVEMEGGREDQATSTATETGICALGKALLYQHEVIPPEQLAQITPIWLHSLPLYVDSVEARICHAIFTTMVEQNNQYLFGPDYSNLPKVLDVICWCITEEGLIYITDEILAKMKAILNHMAQSDPDLFQLALQALSEDQVHILTNVVNAGNVSY